MQMLSKSFKSGKCKTSLKLAISRIKLLKNKRDIQVRHLRQELAQLLAIGQEQTARIRVEHVIREEKTMSGYDLIEIYCELIVARFPIIESQKSCPIDLKEAISSVIFASPRCADLPELVDVRKHFAAKYGKDFITSALELRPDCGVNRMIVEKLSAKAPDTGTKIKILTAIAKEHDVRWDPKAFEEELKNPEDLLNGSSSFVRVNEIHMEPLNANFSSVASQKEADSKIRQNEIPIKPTSFNSPANLTTFTFPVSPTRNESITSDRKPGVSEVRDSYSHIETISSNQSTWSTQFKDAISAAQVAAESAERASIAARAAAELASHGNISRQNSKDLNESSKLSGRNTLPNIVPNSKLKDEHNEFVNMDYNQVKDFQGMDNEADKLPRDQLRGGRSHYTADDLKVKSQINNVEKFDGFLENFSRMESVESKTQHGEADFVEENVEGKYGRSTSASSVGTFNDDSIWAPSIGKHQSGTFRESFSRMEIEKSKKKHDEAAFIEDVDVSYDGSPFASSIGPSDDNTIWVPSIGKQQSSNTHEMNDHNQQTSRDYSSPVFDEYGPEPNDPKNYFLDSFDNKKNNQNFFIMSPTNIFNDSLPDSHAAALEKVPSSKFNDNNTVAYDGSDGTSEDEDNLSRSLKNVTVQNSRLLHKERGSGQESSSSSKVKPLMGSEENYHLQVLSSGSTKNSELDSGSELGLKFGRLTGGLKNRGFNYPPPYTVSSVVHSSLPSKETSGSTISIAKQPISRREKTSVIPVIPDENRYDQESSWKASTSTDSGKAEGSGLNEYTEVSRSNKTLARDKSVEDTTYFGINEFFSNQENNKQYREGNLTNTNVSEPDGEKRDSDIIIESSGSVSAKSHIKLSRRTRDFTTKGRSNSKSTGYTDKPNPELVSHPLSRAVDEAEMLRGNSNLKPPKHNSSAGQQRVHEDSVTKVNTLYNEEKRNPVTTQTISGNNKPLDSSHGMKLQGTESSKASHVHPKLPDYDTLAAHFQSLRSNRH